MTMTRAILRTLPSADAQWHEQQFASLDAAINAYKDLVAAALVPDGSACRAAELYVTEPGMQRATYAPLPGRQENGISGYEPVKSVRLARLLLSRGGAELRRAADPAQPYTEWTRKLVARICAHTKPADHAPTRVTVTWSRAPQSTCSGHSFPSTKMFASADEALDALAKAAERYDELGLRLLHASLDADLRDIDEDVATGVVACLIESMASATLYERATADALAWDDSAAEYRRTAALPAPPMLA